MPQVVEASATNAVGGIDIDIRLLVNLRKFIEDNCIAALTYMTGRPLTLNAIYSLPNGLLLSDGNVGSLHKHL